MTKRRSNFAPLAVIAAVVLCFGGNIFAQQPSLPQTIDVPVTFYDFRSDRSNPEFEQPHQGGRRIGMVAATLDADNKPQLGPTPYRNYGIAHWFRDWNTYMDGPYSRGTNRAPSYTPTPGIRQTYDNEWGATVVYNGDVTVNHDTSFKNIVFPGVLTFTLVNATTGMYEFSRRNDNMFFPLNGRGFGNEWVSVERARGLHNFSFTMELAFEFQARSGMEFNFEGDDDVWVFIDNRLVLEIGGIHEPVSDRFTVANVPGIIIGGTHTLRVFYAERHSEGSNIWIQTNIVAPPATMSISTESNTTGGGIVTGAVDKPADETVTLYSVVYDDNGLILTPGSQYDCNNVTWTIGGRPAGTGCTIEIADSLIGTLNIRSQYRDPLTGNVVEKTVNMTVQALPPSSIHIHNTDDAAVLMTRFESDDIYFNPGENRATAYAVLRDKYGNFVGLAVSKNNSGVAGDWYTQGQPSWSTFDPNVATVTPSDGSSTTVNKEWMGEGTESYIYVSYTVCGGVIAGCLTLSDTVSVGSKSTGAIAAGPNPFVPGQSSIYDRFPRGSEAAKYYENVINRGGEHGILIGVDAPKPLQPAAGSPGGDALSRQYGLVIIYDAVGNIVRRDYLFRANNNVPRSYGFVWNGKNNNGRSVGPGTYLVRVSGRDEDGKMFYVQRTVGVTKR